MKDTDMLKAEGMLLKANLDTVAYNALVRHEWLRTELAQVVDVEQAGYALRADFDLCYEEAFKSTIVAHMIALVKDAIDWSDIARLLSKQWGIPLAEVQP
jgi:hypothetical protein